MDRVSDRIEVDIVNVSAIGSTPTAQFQRPEHDQNDLRRAFDAAANTLGMSTADLRNAIASGQTLSSVAQRRGIDTGTLSTAMNAALSTPDPARGMRPQAPSYTVSAPAAAAEPARTLVPDGPAETAAPPPQVDANAMESLANTMNLTSAELRDQLDAGMSLTDVASANGMDDATLHNTLSQAISTADRSLSTDQASARAKQLITGPPAQQDYSRIAFALAASGAFGTMASQLGAANPDAVAARYQQTQAMVVRPVEQARASGMR
jgi:uncharacterized protein YidB (DUF937 family)